MADNIPSLDDLIKSIQEDDENIPGLDDLLDDIRNEDNSQSSSALAVVPKKEDDLVEEEIDPQILAILGLEDVFDLTYEEYVRELRTAAAAGRIPGSQMSTESIELVTEEYKRVKNKTGKFKVKPKKIDIGKVFNRKTPSPSSAIVKPQKLIPQAAESLQEPEQKPDVDVENLQDDLLNGIGNILESLITIRTVLQSQSKTEQQSSKEDRKETEKKKKKERESTLEKKKPKSPILKSLTKPVDDFFGTIKRFFTNVLLGSVVLGLFKWLKDPKNKEAIDGFTNFLEKNAGIILGGLLAIAALPIATTLLSLTGAITGIAIPALTAAFGFFTSPVGLIALATLAGVTVAYKGIEYATNKATEKAEKILYGEGNVAKGRFITKLRDQYGRIAPKAEYEKMTGEEKTTAAFLKIYDDALVERQKINDELYRLRTMSDDLRVRPKIKEKEKELEYQDKKLRQMESQISIGGKSFSELKKQFEEKGEAGLPQTSLSKRLYPSQPKPQPQTPLMPGASPSQTGLPALPPTNTLPGKQHYGAARPGGRKHAGVDFDAGDNDTFYSRIGGEVIYSANAGGGYGNVVDVYNKELGVTERIAEGSKNLVKVGQNISPGTPVQQGTHQTGVFHYEIRKGKATGSGSFEGTLDPIAFLKNPTTQTQVAQSPTAQVAQTTPPTPSIPSPTGRGNIVPLPIPSGGGSQQVSSGTAPNQAPVPRFSSEDPNNTTTMVVRAIYNIVG